MNPITTFAAQIAALPVNDIDTDQIIPARYLKTTDKVGMGDALFADWRYASDGTPNADFVLNRPENWGAKILIAGDNFGCGSSREHAPWALTAYGFQAVVSTSFADIFRSNSLKNGLLPIIVDAETLAQLTSLAEEEPTTQVRVDLASQTLVLPDGRSVHFPIDPFAKHCLLNGIDQLGFIEAEADATTAFEQRNPARINTRQEIA